MPLTTKTIADTINWAKRLSFNRNPVIGNSLEPALTSANLVMQTILSPPFDWWWNSEELQFTCNPTPNAAVSTAAVIASDVLTVTAANTFAIGNQLIGSGFAGANPLNGLLIEVLTATSSSFTAMVLGLADATYTVGTFTNVTTQDYTVPALNFSHIEHASVLDLSGPVAGVYTPTKWMQLKVQNNLSLESSTGRPAFISPEIEDGSGNITFRVSAAPDKPYPVSIHVELTAPVITSINQTWAPLPDFMEYIYAYGFLALMWQFADDPRALWANNKFTAGLLARADGLTDEERNIFLNNWEMITSTQQMMKQQGTAARGQ
jgi:hypothetical protein